MTAIVAGFHPPLLNLSLLGTFRTTFFSATRKRCYASTRQNVDLKYNEGRVSHTAALFLVFRLRAKAGGTPKPEPGLNHPVTVALAVSPKAVVVPSLRSQRSM